MPPQAQQMVTATVGKHIVLIQATSAADPSSDAARTILKAIRNDPGVSGGQVLVVARA